MGALVQYRDLPGGPTELRLCDELSRHCMCTNCGMLSMSMLQDPNQHMFCETCLMDRSIKYKSDHIYCSYENREVDISEMFEASDLITVIRDQYVKCPNPKCKEYVTLQELKEHYTQCLPAVMCSTCHQQVPSADWSNHNNKCNKQEASGTKSMGAIRKHFQPKEAVPYPNSSPSVKRDSNQNSRETSSLYPSLQEAQRPPQKPTTEDTMLCPYCKRKIKIVNLDGHLEKCSKVPHPCIYCKAQFSKEEIKSHVAICESNPDSVHKQKPEKLEVRNTSVAHPPQDHGGRKANVGTANRNTRNGAWPPSEVLKTSKTNPPQDRGGSRGNENPGNKNTNKGAKPHSESKMTYSPATTAHSKRKCICSPIRTSVESKTTNSQRAKLENKKSYPPNTTTQPIFKWTSSTPKALDESGTTNLQRAMDKQSCCPTRITDTKWTYEFPSRTLDQTETPKSLGEKGKSTQVEDNWRHSSTSTTHSLNKGTYHSALQLGEGETKSQGEKVSTRRLSPHDSGIPVLHALGVPHQDIQAWFIKVESYFSTSRIFESVQKYSITANSLPPQVREAVEDILASPPKTHAYECLLISLFRRNMSALYPDRSKPIGFHTFVQQLPYELRANFKSHCTETIATSAGLCR